MRTVTYGGAVSLDGFLAGANGSLDWLHFSKDVQQVMTDYWKDVDTILMGRKTYEVSVAMRPSSAKKSAKAKSAKRKEPATRTYIFSRTLKAIDDPGVELVATDAADFVRDLKRRSGKGICLMGGGELAQSLLAAGLVDEIGFTFIRFFSAPESPRSAIPAIASSSLSPNAANSMVAASLQTTRSRIGRRRFDPFQPFR